MGFLRGLGESEGWTSCLLVAIDQDSRCSFESVLPARWLFAIAAAVAFLVGSIKPYLAFHAVAIALGVLICTKIGRRYWTGTAGGG